MYYIINENQQIIASNDHFLEHCNVSDITALNKTILLEKIFLDINTETTGEKILTLKSEHQTSLFSMQIIALSSLIGLLSLIVLSPIKTNETHNTSTREIDIKNLIINKQANNTPQLITNIQKELFIQEPISNVDNKNISIDISEISQKIGVSENDYHDFFNDYVSTALSLEKDLQKHTDDAGTNAIETLLHLSNVLHLEPLQNSIVRIQNASIDETSSEIASFYDILSRITLEKDLQKDSKPINFDLDNIQTVSKLSTHIEASKKDIFELDLDIPLIKSKEKKLQQDKPNTSSKLSTQNSNKPFNEELYLSNVQPIHFDFSLSNAAAELSLPENLLKEFMLDFISQVHTEIDTMLNAYQNTDLESIQRTGHLLKGVASNLHITTLENTLYKIQFCNDFEDFGPIIKDFWGHFLSFETQINSLSK